MAGKSNGSEGVAQNDALRTAFEAIVPALIEQGICTQQELEALAGDARNAKKALTVLQKRKFITQRDGGPDFAYAVVWEVQNRDRWRGQDSTGILAAIFKPEEETGDQKWYSQYEVIDIHIELLTPMLGGTPTDSKNLIDFRRVGERIWITEGQLRAAMRAGARLCKGLNKRADSAIRNKYVYISDVFLSADTVDKVRIKCPVENGGGISLHEALLPGALIDFEVNYPGNVFSADDIRQIWARTGRWVGLSPAKHNQGFGKFRLR